MSGSHGTSQTVGFMMVSGEKRLIISHSCCETTTGDLEENDYFCKDFY